MLCFAQRWKYMVHLFQVEKKKEELNMKKVTTKKCRKWWKMGLSLGLAAALCLNSASAGVMGYGQEVKAASSDKKVADWDDDVRVISSAQDLINLSKESGTFEGETIVLNADIEFSKINDFKGICMDSKNKFKGTFDGCGHSISGISISGQRRAGLFGYIGQGGVVQNVTIKDSNFSQNGSTFYAGGIAAQVSGGTIQNCHVKNTKIIQTIPTNDRPGSSASDACLGGIAGYVEYTSKIMNCTFEGEVNGKNSVGGVIGFSNSINSEIVTIVNCANYGLIENGKSATGGIAGWTWKADVKNCFNTGEVIAASNSENVGALAGRTSSSSMFEYCYALDQSCDTLITGTGASSNSAFLSEDKMKDSTFVEELNSNVGGDARYFPWIFTEGEYPHLKEIVNVQDCNISLADGQVIYNGKSQTPKLVIKDGQAGSDELTPEQDYKAVYFNNTARGTASVRIKGKGYYTGSRVFEFEILPYDIKNAMVTLDKSEYRYNGTEQTPSVTIQGTSLVKDRDYTVEYKDNVEVGEATVTINGIGSCDGAMTETFTIERGRLSDCRVILPQDEYTYEGNEILPKVKVMNEKNIALAEEKDYTVNYEDNNGPGTGKIILSGIGNYEGDVEATFDIVELPPTPTPTVKPTPTPTEEPTPAPTEEPTPTPTVKPTPTIKPTPIPTEEPDEDIDDNFDDWEEEQPTAKPKPTESSTISSIQPTAQPTDNNKQSDSLNSTENTVSATPAPTNLATDIKVGDVKRIKVLRKLSKATVTWKKVEGAKGYQICYSASKKFTSKKQITVKKNKVLLKKLKSGKTYFLKVRAYKVNGKKKVYGKWSRKIIKK